MPHPKPLALEAYEQLAHAYAERIDTKAHNAYYERPATLALLPDVHGKRVLDAGCGPGVYTEWLLEHGADVTAVDVSPKMLTLAQQRVGEKAKFHLADLNQPLSFLPEASFDGILSALTLDYVENWFSVFKEFARLTRAGGWLVFSMEHPFAKFLDHPNGNYFETATVRYTWHGFGKPVDVPSYRRPLQAVIEPLLQAGFVLAKLVEPQPIPDFAAADPEEYSTLMRKPGFMCIKAFKA